MKKVASLSIFLLVVGAGFSLAIKPVLAENLSTKLKGRILLQAESRGEAWYISPTNGKRYSMGQMSDAYNLMRKFGLGISNNDLKKIKIANENLGIQQDISSMEIFLTSQDSDGDGLSDSAESAIGTDPNNRDTDGDGYEDKTETIAGYNPLGKGKMPIDNNFAKKQAGKILLEVENKGEAWYVNPVNNQRYFLGHEADAFNLMRKLGLGISNNDLNKIVDGGSFYDTGINLTFENKNSSFAPIEFLDYEVCKYNDIPCRCNTLTVSYVTYLGELGGKAYQEEYKKKFNALIEKIKTNNGRIIVVSSSIIVIEAKDSNSFDLIRSYLENSYSGHWGYY